MEVFSFFYSDKKIVKVLDNFLSNYQFLKLDGEDENTKYFENIETKRNEIYFHFIFKDIEHEFLINYSNSERNIIKNFYNNNQFYTFIYSLKMKIFYLNY